MIEKKENETWFEFMDRAKANGFSPTQQEEIDRLLSLQSNKPLQPELESSAVVEGTKPTK